MGQIKRGKYEGIVLKYLDELVYPIFDIACKRRCDGVWDGYVQRFCNVLGISCEQEISSYDYLTHLDRIDLVNAGLCTHSRPCFWLYGACLHDRKQTKRLQANKTKYEGLRKPFFS